jgi:hypothetical protein
MSIDFTKITGILKDIGKNSIGLYAVDMLGLNNMVQNENNTIIRALKVGSIFYIVKLGVETVDQGTMPKITIQRVVDDTLFYSISSLVSDKLGITNFIDQNTPNIVSGKLEDVIKSAIVWTVISESGKMLENTGLDVVRHMSQKLGL